SADGFLDEISKVWNVTELQSFAIFQMLSGWDMRFQRSMTFWMHHRRNFEDLQLPNTTELNFEDSAFKRNFEGPRLPKRLMDRISEICA
ncbi:hypothetical protein RclHR1_04480001, partial [Rhizophagus clarus]